jgi:hypothetical protein
MRALPSACVAEVRKICQHYVHKTSGKYTNNAAAARYIHQMSEEVLSQLADVAAEIKRHESSPEVFQQLLDDWNEVFPPTLGEIGTPKAIASKLKSQAVQIEELRLSLEELKSMRDQDLNGVLRSMDSQLQSSRDSVANERRQLLFAHSKEVSALNDKLARIVAENEENLKSLAKSYKSTVETLKCKLTKLEDAKNGELAEASAAASRREQELLDRIAQLAREKQVMSDSLKSRSREVEELNRRSRRPSFVPERKIALASTNSIASSVQSDRANALEDSFRFDIEDSATEVELCDEDEDDEEEEAAEEEEGDEEEEDDNLRLGADYVESWGPQGQEKKLRKGKKKGKAKKSRRKSTVTTAPVVSVRGAVAQKLASLTEEIKSLSEVNSAREEDMKLMQTDIDKLLVELSFQKRRADGLEETNAALRKAIAVDISQSAGAQVIRGRVTVTKYTPHFLQHTRSEPHCT